ncbi:SIS domain-containing protein [Alteromonas pelagimontana]|uniref:SIS domain-containing protein n=1 Tax=Alteromonas pelagimontana TaxID=1858656 RepID=A0A6M4MF43_9ALTE|nr:SIS domain-containing protein [Alteromonas pelagimontana]QJR81703.1 SIS domain-containing protein [Alteromonas pelagimontana]
MTQSIMEQEALQTASVVEHQIRRNIDVVERLVSHLKHLDPTMVMLIGRGSSDHAGVFAKYLIEVELNIPTFAAAPSVSSVFKQQLRLKGAVAIIISQSGRSPDIISQAEMAKAGGAYCIAIVNDESSPLAELVDAVIPICAGEEQSVAATKSFLGTLSALVHLVSVWSDNRTLYNEFQRLPGALVNAAADSVQLQPDDFASTTSLVVLGRGFGYAIAKEIALKMKEVCCIQAEAFSSAEFSHGPITLVSRGLTVLNCNIMDESYQSHATQVAEVKNRKATVLELNAASKKTHPRLLPLLVLQRFYIDVARISVSLGLNPDSPQGLKKVTETL